MARTRLAKLILDAAWGTFLSVLQAALAAFPPCDGGKLCSELVKRGKHAIGDDPKGTSIECSNCGERVVKDLDVRIHDCPHCNLVLDRDWNAAINILNRVLRAVGLTLSGCGGLGNTQPLKQQISFVNLRSPRYSALGA